MPDHVNLNDFTGTWDYATLPANVSLGKACFLERREAFSEFRSTRTPGLVLGDRVQVLTWTNFNVEPAGYVQVGDDTLVAGATFMAAESIVIGARCVVSYNVTLADSDFHPLDVGARRRDAVAIAPFGDRSQRPPILARPIVIEDDVWIGIGCIILKGVRIGKGATIAPGTVVTRDVPPETMIGGNPARIVATQEAGSKPAEPHGVRSCLR